MFPLKCINISTNSQTFFANFWKSTVQYEISYCDFCCFRNLFFWNGEASGRLVLNKSNLMMQSTFRVRLPRLPRLLPLGHQMKTEWRDIIRKHYLVDPEYHIKPHTTYNIETVGEDYSGSNTNDKSDPSMFLFVCIFEGFI